MGKEKGPPNGKDIEGREISTPQDGPFRSNGDSSHEQSEKLPPGFENWNPERQKQWRIWKQGQDKL